VNTVNPLSEIRGYRPLTREELGENPLLLSCTCCEATMPSSGALVRDGLVYCSGCANIPPIEPTNEALCHDSPNTEPAKQQPHQQQLSRCCQKCYDGDAIDDILAVPELVHSARVAHLRVMRLVLEDVQGQLERTLASLKTVPNRRTAGGGGL
jgi:hypothetical protein